jgi:hypothetical protein
MLKNIEIGEDFKVGNLEFVVLEHKEETTAVILKDFWKTAKFDSSANDYKESEIRKDLNNAFYYELSGAIGTNNIVKHTVDLTADDGRIDYKQCEDYISLLTCDLYRKYVYVLEKYNPESWWWLATAYSTKSNDYTTAVRCVRSFGTLSLVRCYYYNGVRPFWEKVRKSKLYAEIRTLLTKECITFLLFFVFKSIYDRF